MVQRKDQIVGKIRNGLEGLIKSNGITVFKGFGKFTAPKEIKVMGEDNAFIQAENIIIATGSEPRSIPAFPYDYQHIHDSTSLLEMRTLPKSIAIIGGGIIGCEFASLYAAFGVEVTLFELLPRILPMEGSEISAVLHKALEQKGVRIHTQAQVAAIDSSAKGVSVRLNNNTSVAAEIALVAVGRTLNTQKIGLENTGVAVQENGGISVNDRMETNVPGIYAIGDIASKWWLAHVATHQGLVAVDNILGEETRMNYDAIPSVIFTDPEIATIGLTLEDAQKKGYDAVTGAFPFQALGKAQASHHTEGFAQIILDKRTGQLLGAQVVGNEASTLIAEMAVAIANELTVECIVETIHAHPTTPEAWMEAALMGSGFPLHLPPKKMRK
jgi:dihydrolipoamide dehydrogenase